MSHQLHKTVNYSKKQTILFNFPGKMFRSCVQSNLFTENIGYVQVRHEMYHFQMRYIISNCETTLKTRQKEQK